MTPTCLFHVGDKGFAYTFTPSTVSGALTSFSDYTVTLNAVDTTGASYSYSCTVAEDGSSATYTKGATDFPNAGRTTLALIVTSDDGTIIAQSDPWDAWIGESL